MTPEQYERWKDFALRAARTWYKTHRRPDAAWAEEVVAEWFDCFDADDIPCVVDWDNSTEYPEGSPYRRQNGSRPCMCQYPDGYMTPRPPNPDCEHCAGTGAEPRFVGPCPVCDMMTEFLDCYRPFTGRCRACAEYDDETECRCDERAEQCYQQWDDQWGGPVRCCVRAGLDLASGPSAGVVGFTAGDLRAMYPEGVPDWIKNGDWEAGQYQECAIGLIPVECALDPQPFDKMPDNQGVWL